MRTYSKEKTYMIANNPSKMPKIPEWFGTLGIFYNMRIFLCIEIESGPTYQTPLFTAFVYCESDVKASYNAILESYCRRKSARKMNAELLHCKKILGNNQR
jgi:hypothetical protein